MSEQEEKKREKKKPWQITIQKLGDTKQHRFWTGAEKNNQKKIN